MAPAISVYCRKRLARPRINYTKKEKKHKENRPPAIQAYARSSATRWHAAGSRVEIAQSPINSQTLTCGVPIQYVTALSCLCPTLHWSEPPFVFSSMRANMVYFFKDR